MSESLCVGRQQHKRKLIRTHASTLRALCYVPLRLLGGKFSFLFVHNWSPALSQAEEKKVSEKTLQTPLLPSPVADHVKCNILKAQLENASRVSAQVRGTNAPSISRFRISSMPPLGDNDTAPVRGQYGGKNHLLGWEPGFYYYFFKLHFISL